MISLIEIRPRIIASRCLGFDAVRYDGRKLDNPLFDTLYEYVDVVHVCPELAIGLGVPRPKIRLLKEGDDIRLIQPDSNKDLTSQMATFSQQFCSQLSIVDGFLLKSKSPSCGIGSARQYADRHGDETIGTLDGMFVRSVRRFFPDAILIDEHRFLTDSIARRQFLLDLYVATALREHHSRELGEKRSADLADTLEKIPNAPQPFS